MFGSLLSAPPSCAHVSVTETRLPNVRLDIAKSSSLADALSQVAEQTGVSFLLEGHPFHKRGAPSPLSGLSSKDLSGSAETVIRTVAGAYDYDVEPVGEVFLLRKRFTNPDDLPEMSEEECRISLEQAQRAIRALYPTQFDAPGDRQAQVITELTASLNQEQIAAIQTQNGLSISVIPAECRQDIYQLILWLWLKQANLDSQRTLADFDAAAQKQTAFRFNDRFGTSLFGYETFYKDRGSLLSVPLSHTNEIRSLFGGTVRFWTGKAPSAVPASLRLPDPSEPAEADYDSSGRVLPREEERYPSTETLEDFAARLNQAAKSDGQTISRFSVDKAYASKSLTIIGKRSLSSRTQFSLASRLFGLHIRDNPDDSLTLTHAQIPLPRSPEQVGDTVWSAFPASLRRAYQNRKAKIIEEPAEKAKIRIDRSYVSLLQDSIAGSKARDSIRVHAIHRLRTLIEPQIKSSPDGRVLYSSLGEEEHQLLSLILIQQSFEALDRAFSSPPRSYIMHFQETTITGAFGHGTEFFPTISYGGQNGSGQSLGSAILQQ